MKTLIALIMLMLLSQNAFATKNFNSSKSNTSSVSNASTDVIKMVEAAKKDALQIANAMIRSESRKAKKLDIKVTVSVSVVAHKSTGGTHLDSWAGE